LYPWEANLSRKKAERFNSGKELMVRGSRLAEKNTMDTSKLKISCVESYLTPHTGLQENIDMQAMMK
jgi:hypothetical protein